MIDSAIIPAAGLGTRLTPFTKEIPKEMLPILIKRNENIIVEPVLHYIYDSLYSIGIRNFLFIVGRGKRVIEDYFTPDWSFVEYLKKIGKHKESSILEEFYEKIENSNIIMVNQPEPKGFGDAVLRTRNLINTEPFIVHAGDDIIYPTHSENIVNLLNHYYKYRPKAVFLYDVSNNPERYGVITGEDKTSYIEVYDIVEKPEKPLSRNVVVAIYVFDKEIFEALDKTKPSKGEHQLTDAIKYLLKKGYEIHAVRVNGIRLDLGTPDQYLYALKTFVEKSLLG
ncbi:MAG: sugar phosphate nucleotidyltransferase [Desulfurococcaceae archaeon]